MTPSVSSVCPTARRPTQSRVAPARLDECRPIQSGIAPQTRAAPAARLAPVGYCPRWVTQTDTRIEATGVISTGVVRSSHHKHPGQYHCRHHRSTLADATATPHAPQRRRDSDTTRTTTVPDYSPRVTPCPSLTALESAPVDHRDYRCDRHTSTPTSTPAVPHLTEQRGGRLAVQRGADATYATHGALPVRDDRADSETPQSHRRPSARRAQLPRDHLIHDQPEHRRSSFDGPSRVVARHGRVVRDHPWRGPRSPGDPSLDPLCPTARTVIIARCCPSSVPSVCHRQSPVVLPWFRGGACLPSQHGDNQ